MTENIPQCPKCKHYMANSSCGPCVDKGTDMIESIAKELGVDAQQSEEDEILALKSSCKILSRYPEDFNVVNPCECKYYMSAAYGFR